MSVQSYDGSVYSTTVSNCLNKILMKIKTIYIPHSIASLIAIIFSMKKTTKIFWCASSLPPIEFIRISLAEWTTHRQDSYSSGRGLSSWIGLLFKLCLRMKDHGDVENPCMGWWMMGPAQLQSAEHPCLFNDNVLTSANNKYQFVIPIAFTIIFTMKS